MKAVRDGSPFREPMFVRVLLLGCLLSLIAWGASVLLAGRASVCGLAPAHTVPVKYTGGALAIRHAEFRDRDGRLLGTVTRPLPHEYALAAGGFLLPFVIWGYGRRLTRAR